MSRVESLRKAIIEEPMLALPYYTRVNEAHIDASDFTLDVY